MKAPEKLYLPKRNKLPLEVVRGCEWFETDPQRMYGSVEYTRTDAFIEKACDFFEENIEEEDCKIGSSEWTELKAEYKSLDSFIRAFVEYMKRE